MDWLDQVWKFLIELPKALNQFAGFSYSLLTILLLGGLAVYIIHIIRQRQGVNGIPTPILVFAGILIFLSLGGFGLKWGGSIEDGLADKSFITKTRAANGVHHLLIFDFLPPADSDPGVLRRHQLWMRRLESTVRKVLLEEIPPEFQQQPRVVRINTIESPWPRGVSDNNFHEVIKELNAVEIMWGEVFEEGMSADIFLGIVNERDAEHDKGVVLPLDRFDFDQDPSQDLQVGKRHLRLLGVVALSLARGTYNNAMKMSNQEKRKQLFLLAIEQFNKTRELVNNQREDPMLQRTVYSDEVNALIGIASREGGLQ